MELSSYEPAHAQHRSSGETLARSGRLSSRDNAHPLPDGRPAVLIVDDDLGTRESFSQVLNREGFRVGLAGSGREALMMVRAHPFDLWVIDLQLGDMPGTELARTLHDEGTSVPFVMVSAWLTTDATVEAMKLGAADVIEKPLTLEDMRNVVLSVLGEGTSGSRSPASVVAGIRPRTNLASPAPTRPRSAAERWARHVLKACDADGDPRTLDDWAACAGVSKSSLCETCHLLDIKPRDARDFARLLRALIRSRIHPCKPAALLDVSDRRTLDTLVARAGVLPETSADDAWLDEFLRQQQLVSAVNEGLLALRSLLGRRRSA
jgi:CheY-like chemotaxis protein